MKRLLYCLLVAVTTTAHGQTVLLPERDSQVTNAAVTADDPSTPADGQNKFGVEVQLRTRGEINHGAIYPESPGQGTANFAGERARVSFDYTPNEPKNLHFFTFSFFTFSLQNRLLFVSAPFV